MKDRDIIETEDGPSVAHARAAAAQAHLCFFGILTENRCACVAVWVTTYDGQPTGPRWCEKHKPSGPPIARHGLQKI